MQFEAVRQIALATHIHKDEASFVLAIGNGASQAHKETDVPRGESA